MTTRRLGLMNCFLHEIEPDLYLDNSLSQGPHAGKKYNLILTNPPFGSGGSGGVPTRDDFLFPTSNKQLNFVQHVMTILKPMGQVAMIVPDGVLFDNAGKGIREHLFKTCNLHTILRLPEGTFVPYANARANVIFFTKGNPTKETWIYDLRTNIPNMRKRNPLTDELFNDFENCYHENPRKPNKQFKKFTINQIIDNDFKIDFRFVEDQSIENIEDLPDPKIIANQISKDLKSTITSIDKLVSSLN